MKNLFTLLLVFISATAFCQVGGMSLSPTGSPPDASAMLDVSSSTKGFLLPRLTQTQRDSITNPAFGLMVLNTTTNCFNVWLGSTWKQICGDCDFNSPVPGNNGPICQGQTLNLTATNILGATYHWTGPNGFSSNQQNPSISNAAAGASGSYSVQATLNGCTSQPQSTVATVNAIPQTPTASNNGPVCAGQSINLTSTTIAGASYTWSGPNGFAANSQNPAITNIQTNQGGIYNVVANVAGCNSESAPTNVVVNVTPGTPHAINGLDTVCHNSSGNVYYIDTIDEATTYTWTVPAGGNVVNGQGTTNITVTYGTASGNVGVTAGNACGTSAASFLPVTVLTPPQTFNYTGAVQTFIVPNCVTSVTITAYGAQGASQYGNGGLGGSATGTLAVTPGQALYVFVGGQNNFNGGGQGNQGCNGGDESDVRVGGTAISNWVIVAGGGGGGGNNGSSYVNAASGTGGGGNGCANGAGGGPGAGSGPYGSAGGAGTCTNGGGGGSNNGGWSGGGGGGGLTSGGDGGINYNGGPQGGAGTQGQGGTYAPNNNCGCSGTAAGGGGGGYYGGGGGTTG